MKCHNKIKHFCGKHVFTFQGKCQRWIPVIFVIFTIIASYLIFNFQILEVVTKSYIRKQIDIITITFLFIMYLWSFIKTMITKSKEIPEVYRFSPEIVKLHQVSSSSINFDEITKKHVLHYDLPIQNRLVNGGFRYCNLCMIVKPDRTHHCSTCNKCIPKFDHHCPWINNCVMFTNYKYFLLFLIYGTLLHLSLAINNIESIVDFISHKGSIKYRHVDTTIIICFTINFVINFGSLVAIISMLLWHLTLVGRNLTTNESYRSPFFTFGASKKEYNISLRHNFSEVFGSNILLWFIPIWTSKGDGFIFKQKKYCKNDINTSGKKSTILDKNSTLKLAIDNHSSNDTNSKILEKKEINKKIETNDSCEVLNSSLTEESSTENSSISEQTNIET
uniref:Palmitoyltransferase n=1 Tax=Strongyloides stercoralis TaxID=6248 RepID=A0A0K0EHM7_STRER